MAVNFQEIDVNNLSQDVVIDSKTKYGGIYFKGVGDLDTLTMEGSDTGNNLTVTTASGHKIILTDYFAKNGTFPIKTIKTDSNTYDLITYVNDHYYKGAKQNIMGGGMVKSVVGTVFDDVIMEGGDQTISAVGGNDKIYASDSNSTLIGGVGTNTMIYEYDDWDNQSFGIDIIQLTKGETLNLNVTYNNDTTTEPIPLHLNRGTGKNMNDLIITNDKNTNDSITIKNYYGKDTGATVLINGHDYSTEVLAALNFNSNHIVGSNFTGSALADSINASGVGQQYKKSGAKTNLVINSGAGNDDITGSNYGNTINAGTGDDTVRGGAADDIIMGGAGHDTIYGSAGNDKITGGAGNNTIIYAGQFGTDIITLTKKENLTIDLSSYGIASLNDATKFTASLLGKDLKIKILGQGTIILKNYANNILNSLNIRLGIGNLLENLNINNFSLGYSDDDFKTNDKNKTATLTSSAYDDDIKVTLAGYTKTINSGKGNDRIIVAGNDKVVVNSGLGDDIIVSGAGNDIINAGDGSDYITGGLGNDKLTGGKGSDRFIFTSGDGIDTITDADNTDKIQITNVNAADLCYSKNGNNLEIFYDNSFDPNNKIVIQNYFSKKEGVRVNELIAQDTTINLSNIVKQSGYYQDYEFYSYLDPSLRITFNCKVMNGNEKNNLLISSNKYDVINPAGGNDTIYLQSRLAYVEDTSGNDRYVVSSLNNGTIISDNSGFDEIVINDLQKNINFIFNVSRDTSPADYENFLFILNNSTAQKVAKTNNLFVNSGIQINDYFSGEVIEQIGTKDCYITPDEIDRVKANVKTWLQSNSYNTALEALFNGSMYEKNQLWEIYKDIHWVNRNINGTSEGEILTGTDYSETIYGYAGNDTINGKAGNNLLYGGSGNDTYINSDLTNFDTINDESGANDKISVTGVNKNNLVLRFDLKVDGFGNIIEDQSRNMYITKTTDFGDAEIGIKVTNQFVEGHSIETITTADNYTLTTDKINQLRENVAGWLLDGGFESVQQIIDSGNGTNIASLITQFQTADWQAV